jgi:hypothetical protein
MNPPAVPHLHTRLFNTQAAQRHADEPRRARDSPGAAGSIGLLGNSQLDVGTKFHHARVFDMQHPTWPSVTRLRRRMYYQRPHCHDATDGRKALDRRDFMLKFHNSFIGQQPKCMGPGQDPKRTVRGDTVIEMDPKRDNLRQRGSWRVGV